MAPMCPEEVDVFTIPHSRMKTLVNKYLKMMTCTNFSNVSHLTSLLQNLYNTFHEFKAHEQIENKFIMKKLKHKLRALSIQNSAVCNCHKDDQLSSMLDLLQDGYRCTMKTDVDRINFGLQLKQELDTFTKNFLPHMAEEEEVFQPLLMQYFSVDELKQIKATVIQEHFTVEAETSEKFIEDISSCELPSVDQKVNKEKETDLDTKASVSSLSDEMLLKIFSHLNARDLCRTAQVSRRWNDLSLDGSLWTDVYPVQWAMGNWDAMTGIDLENEMDDAVNRLHANKILDEDADIDESEDVDEMDTEAQEIQYQSDMLTSLCKHVLPRVGHSVKTCNLAYSKGVTNGTLYKILTLCPNLETIDLSQTRVSDLGFKGLLKKGCGRHLKHVDLTGCLFVSDVTLHRLAVAVCRRQENKREKDCNERPEKTSSCFCVTHNEKPEKNKKRHKCWKPGDEEQTHCGSEKKSGIDLSVEIEKVDHCKGRGEEDLKWTTFPSKLNCETRVGNCDTDLEMGRDFPERISPSVSNDSERTQTFIDYWNISDRINEIQSKSAVYPCRHGCRNTRSDQMTRFDGCWLAVQRENESQMHQQDFSITPSCENGCIETCELQPRTFYPNSSPNIAAVGQGLEFLSLSGCYKITDDGLRHLSDRGGLPNLTYLDLSGCLNLTADGLTALVDTCTRLDPRNLFYCDNILEGPYWDTASGCQNLQCPSKVCCRLGE